MKRICLVVADATRARIYTYEQLQEPDGPHEQLREELDLVDPARRKRPSELFSDDSGANHAGTRGYAYDDHRQAHLDHFDTSFAHDIAAAIDRIVRANDYHTVVVIASSRMLGALRTSLEPLKRTVAITELERDFTKLATPALRDRLAELDVLPPRPRG